MLILDGEALLRKFETPEAKAHFTGRSAGKLGNDVIFTVEKYGYKLNL